MNTNCFEILEYNKVLEILSEYTKTFLGKKMALNLKPSFDVIEVTNLGLQTSQALDMIK